MTFSCLSPETIIRDALAVMNEAQMQIGLVTDPDGRLVRTLTDGDIRRALLEGADLDTRVGVLEAQPPVICQEGDDRDTMLGAMIGKGLSALVMVDAQMRPLRLVTRTDLEGKILLSPPHLGEEELGFVRKAFEDNWIAPTGPHLDAFERVIAEKSDRRHALAVSSGTAALHLALCVLRVGRGDRVYVSDLTFVASVQPILYQGGAPVLIDSEPEGWNMSPAALARKLEEDKKAGCLPKAIIVVHIYGQSAEMGSIMELADRYGVAVIEDAAESLGASYRNRPSGAHGLLSAFSFNGNKIITTSGGGALVTDREDLIGRARYLSTQGRMPTEHYQHVEVAFNYRMSNVLAGIGLGQMKVLEARVARRREIFRLYREALQLIEGVRFQEDFPGSRGSRWLTVIELDSDKLPIHGYQLIRRLRARGIETRPAWKPMHLQPLCRNFEMVTHSDGRVVAARHFLSAVCLPSGSAMTNDDVARVIDEVRVFLKTSG